MILKEKDLEKFEKKIILACHYYTDSKSKLSRFGYNRYYDLGEGIINEEGFKHEDIMPFDSCWYQSKVLESERQRGIEVKDLYSDGLKYSYPIFLKFEDDYFYLNEYAFDKPNDKEIAAKVWEKYEGVIDLMHMHKKEDYIPHVKRLRLE